MRRWFADGVFRAVMRNAGYLGSTKLIAALLGLVALACAGRVLTPATFGILMVVHTYATGAGALVKFQSWQLIVRYGAPALQRGETLTARDAIRFAFGLDVASGLTGMTLAMAALPTLAGYFQIRADHLTLALIYCTLVPTMSAATPAGTLRLLDRFDLLAAQQLMTPSVRVVGAGIAAVGQFGFTGFVVTWYIADLAGDAVLWAFAARELRRRGMLDALRPRLARRPPRLPDAWSFAWSTNLATSLGAAWGPVSNLIVAGILGPVAAGLYKIASTLLDSAGKPADLLAKGFYPEVMRLDPASKRPWKLALRVGLFAGGFGLIAVAAVLIGGKPLIAFAFGRKYLQSYDVLRVMILAVAVSMAAFPLPSLLHMIGRQRVALAAHAAATCAYLPTLALLCHVWGLEGAGNASWIGATTLACFTAVPVLSNYRRRARYARAA